MAFANSDPYEDWKAQGRPGGNYNSWYTQQTAVPPPPAAGGAAPPPPPPPSPTPQPPAPPVSNRPPAGAVPPPPPPPALVPPPPPPQGNPYGDLSGFKTYADWQSANKAGGGPGESADVARHFQVGQTGRTTENYNAFQPQNEQQQTARMPAGSFPDDSPDAGNWNTGDPYLDELRSGKVAGSEDWRRFSNAQLKEWQPFYLGNGKFRTEDGGVSDKPPNSTKPQGAPGGPGGGGAGAMGGAGAVPPPPAQGAGGAGGNALDEMTQYWKELTKQSGSRYTPEAMAALEADAFARARAQEKLQLDQARGDMAQRGMARSADQSAAIRGIGVGTGQQIMANRAQIQRAKIDADFQDKQAAIQNAQNWVNSMRDYMLRTDMNAIQREQMAAQIRLAQMNIKAQSQQLRQQYEQNLSLNEQQAGLNLSTDFARGAWQ